jgi:hypothetical protein
MVFPTVNALDAAFQILPVQPICGISWLHFVFIVRPAALAGNFIQFRTNKL